MDGVGADQLPAALRAGRDGETIQAAQNRQCGDPIGGELLEISDCDAWTGVQKPPIEQQYVKKEMGECMMGYIARLPEIYRSVLLLSDMEELSNTEIAEILGITLDTVKIRLHRARALLKEEFETHCEYYWVSELSWRAM